MAWPSSAARALAAPYCWPIPPLAKLTEFDAGLNQVAVHGKRLRDGLFALSNVEAPLKTGH
ncbi:MAG TPA: hypothetical protein VGK09_09865 [Rhodocyclaceae bacterium]